jgi:hypothetical protein
MFERRLNIMELPSYEESEREANEGRDTSVIVNVSRPYSTLYTTFYTFCGIVGFILFIYLIESALQN